jgi:hypothetical protein
MRWGPDGQSILPPGMKGRKRRVEQTDSAWVEVEMKDSFQVVAEEDEENDDEGDGFDSSSY